MRIYQAFIGLAIATLLGVSSAFADSQALGWLEGFRKSETGMSMGFVQTLTDAQGGVLERQEGRVEILPPDRFVWRYASPYELEFGSNGVLVWHWDHDLAQITVRDAQKIIAGTPLALMLDLDQQLPIEEESDQWLRWVPEDDSAQFAELRMHMGPDGPLELILVDFLDQRTRVLFDNHRRPDASVDPRFPKVGTDVLVVDERDQP